jgi:hypothetical protein
MADQLLRLDVEFLNPNSRFIDINTKFVVSVSDSRVSQIAELAPNLFLTRQIGSRAPPNILLRVLERGNATRTRSSI